MNRTIMPQRLAVLAPVFAVIAAATLVVVTMVLNNSDDPLPEIALGFSSDRFPSEDLSHWVTYPTQISVVTVVSEREIPPPARVLERGEGYVGRSVELRIDRTLWSAPEVEAQTGNIEFVASGWLRKGDKQIPFGSADGPRLEVGNRYVIPLVPTERGWAFLSNSAVLSVDRTNRIAHDQERIKNPASLAHKGATLDALAKTLGSTAPDPAAAPFAHLPPDERVEAVFRAARIAEGTSDAH